jgi:hypothetical protein
MSLSTLQELQAQFEALTLRIGALDKDIALETDSERRGVLREKRADLAREREQVAAQIEMAQHGNPGPRVSSPPIEHRVLTLEEEVRRIWHKITPGPRQLVARIVFYSLLAGLWSMWMVKEVRDWLIANPAQAIVISLAMFVAALIIRWLPETDHDER